MALCSPGETTTVATAAATSANVNSTSGFPTSGRLLIDSEEMNFTGTTATSFTGLMRGQFDTTAASHAANARLSNLVNLTGVTAIAAGGAARALKSDGTMVAWGNNIFTAVPVSGLAGITAIANGSGHSLAPKSDGTVVAWGNNASG